MGAFPQPQACKNNTIFRGVPRIWEGGGAKKFFFQIWEAMRIARGVRGHAPPRKFFKTVQFGAF